MVRAVVLTGAPGSGKSSVLDALTTRLEIEGVAPATGAAIGHGLVDGEVRLDDQPSPWNTASTLCPSGSSTNAP